MISVYFNGRLGNNIFQYIYCRICSIENGCKFFIPSKENSNKYYRDISKRLNIKLQGTVDGNPHYWEGDELFNINYGENDNNISHLSTSNINDICDTKNVTDGCLLDGYFQTDNYMVGYEDVIINDWLKINEITINNSTNIIDKYPPEDYCYIHFRGKDYKNIPQFFLPIGYYKNAIDKVKHLNKNINFLIITDDPTLAKEYFPNFTVISNSTEIDFYLLTQAIYNIIPNSSFSWWAAWLNKNVEIVISPNNWFNYNGHYGEGFFPHHIKTNKFYYI